MTVEYVPSVATTCICSSLSDKLGPFGKLDLTFVIVSSDYRVAADGAIEEPAVEDLPLAVRKYPSAIG